jgi:hypothetical protein
MVLQECDGVHESIVQWLQEVRARAGRICAASLLGCVDVYDGAC